MGIYTIVRGTAAGDDMSGTAPFALKKTRAGAKMRVNSAFESTTLKFTREELVAMKELISFFLSYSGDVYVSSDGSTDIVSSDASFNEYSFYSPYL